MSRQTRQRGRSAPHLADSFAPPRWPSGLLGRQKHGGDGLQRWDLEKRASCSTVASMQTQQMLSPRLHRGAHNRGSRFVERPQLTIYGRHTSRDVDRGGIRMSRWPWSSSCECARSTLHLCARHDRVNSDIHSYVRHPRSAISGFKDTRRWGWMRGTTWNVWRRCMVCDSPRAPWVGNLLSPSRAHDSSLGGLSALIYPR